MIKFFKLAGLAAVAAGCLTASQITTQNINFDTSGIPLSLNIASYVAQATNMAGMTVTVTWANGGPAAQTCIWSDALGGCSGANFSVGETDGSVNHSTYDGTWSVTNNANTTRIASITLTGNGFVGFDTCWIDPSGPQPPQRSSTNNGLDGNFTGPAHDNCGIEGTPGSNIGWTASGLANSGSSTARATSVTYSTLIKLTSAANPVGDEFNQVVLNFGSDNSFSAGSTFTWRMDSDIFSSPVPEPATFGLVGLSLLALGAVNKRRRRNSR